MIAAMNTNSLSTERTLEILIKHGADINLQNKEGLTALMYAVKFSYSSTEMLLKNHASVNIQDIEGNTALHHLLFFINPQESIVEILINNGANVHIQNIRGETPLSYSLQKFNLKMLSKRVV